MPKKTVSMKALIIIIGVLVSSFFLLIVNRQITLFNTGLETYGRGVAHQILLTRAWAASYGGVWVNKEVGSYHDEQNGMYLKTPAMITSEISNLLGNDGLYSFRLASDRPVNSNNVLKDKQEEEALLAFSQGEKEYTKLVNGQYRYIVPINIDDNCLECHSKEGYQLGELRGILSITIPAVHKLRQLNLIIILYLVGSVGSFLLASMVTINWINQQFVNPLTIMIPVQKG